jgi:hypothetical protein
VTQTKERPHVGAIKDWTVFLGKLVPIGGAILTIALTWVHGWFSENEKSIGALQHIVTKQQQWIEDHKDICQKP